MTLEKFSLVDKIYDVDGLKKRVTNLSVDEISNEDIPLLAEQFRRSDMNYLAEPGEKTFSAIRLQWDSQERYPIGLVINGYTVSSYIFTGYLICDDSGCQDGFRKIARFIRLAGNHFEAEGLHQDMLVFWTNPKTI